MMMKGLIRLFFSILVVDDGMKVKDGSRKTYSMHEVYLAGRKQDYSIYSKVWIYFMSVLPVSPACNCMDCMHGVTPSKTYILLLLFGQKRN